MCTCARVTFTVVEMCYEVMKEFLYLLVLVSKKGT